MGWRNLQHLTSQLRADRTTSAGDHDCLAGQFSADRFCIEFYRLATQKIFNPNVADAANLDPAFDDFIEFGNDSHLHRDLVAYFYDAVDLLPRRMRNSNDDMVDAVRMNQPGQVVSQA